ncbi:hypothetical protein QQZ08_009095 [Neonectria magnoliae]|uniref:LysM domain-containing protein n=1 Tax=Neonectria magnoliae TaxID=2732573 RepID=A0ABR1HQD5_9HYPO
MVLRIASSSLLLGVWLQIVVAQDTSPGGPVHEGQPDNCNAWHTIAEGDTCATVPELCGISRDQLLEWNPAVSYDCLQNFWLGNAYCVGVGEAASTGSSSVISTTSNSESVTTSSVPVTTTLTTASQNTTYSIREPIITWNITVPTIDTAWPPTATQAGQPTACNRWHLVVAGQTCENVMNKYGRFMTLEQLHEWNPELHQDCSGLYADYWICVSVRSIWPEPDLQWSTSTSDFTPLPEPTSHELTVYPTANSSFSPVPSHGSMPESCKHFHQVEADENCGAILDIYNYVTQDQFFEWNPVLDGDCNGLWSGNWYCVGAYESGNPMPPTVTATPSQVPTGSPDDCAAWYLTTLDDTCDLIASIFGTFDIEDFIAWNPSVFEDCTDIEQDTWYCVGKADTPTTRTDGAPTPTAPGDDMPTQSGISEDCISYWLVSEDDTCKSIAAANSIPEKNLIDWNPALRLKCDGLDADYYICVGIDTDDQFIEWNPAVGTECGNL